MENEVRKQSIKSQIQDALRGRWPSIGKEHLLFVLNEGFAIFPHMDTFADLVNKNKIIKFTGNYRWFEFHLLKPDNFSGFVSLRDLEHCIYVAKRFSNEYSGIVCVDLSDWVNNFDSILLSRFLRSLDSYGSSTIFAFSLYTNNILSVRKAEDALLRTLSIQTIFDSAWREIESEKHRIGFGGVCKDEV